MKPSTCALKCGLAILLITVASFASSHEAHHEAKKTEVVDVEGLEKINASYVENVKPLFQKACFDCHSSGASLPWYSSIPGVKQLIQSDIEDAQKHLDMTNDFPFKSHASPKEDLESILKAVTDDSMPPLRFRVMHPSSSFSKVEQKLVEDWVDQSLKELRP